MAATTSYTNSENNSSNNKEKIINRLDWIRQDFTLTPDIFKAIVNGFKQECDQGLNTASASGLATMIPSYVTRLPTGNETGTYLALDLGGSTLRVCAVELLGQGQVNVTEVRRSITDQVRTSSTIVFFDWIADTVAELYALLPNQQVARDDDAPSPPPLAMGVSWSFPLDQTGISKGTILRMGKGFTVTDGIDGQDLASLFLEAFRRKNVHVVVTAIVNDTIGALVAHAYSNPQARVGFIYGTGVNAAYPEKVSRIIKLNVAEWQDTATQMLVNTEIDIFGNESYLPFTRFDRALDASHAQPGFQPYEKMMSGAYLGELVRLVAIDLVNDLELFGGHVPNLLAQPWSFLTAHMSEIEGYSRHDHQLVSRVTELLQFTDGYIPTEVDTNTFLDICVMVSTRAAGLAAAALVAIIEQQSFGPSDDIVIGVNGTTFEMYPRMPQRIHQALEQWFGESVAKRIKLEVARDGGSIGAALVAMLYQEGVHSSMQSTSSSTAREPSSQTNNNGGQRHSSSSTEEGQHRHRHHRRQPRRRDSKCAPFLDCLFGWAPWWNQSKNKGAGPAIESISSLSMAKDEKQSA